MVFIFFHILVLQEYWVLSKSSIPLKQVLWGVRIVTLSISSHEQIQFIKIISHYKKIGYNINVLQQTACLVVNPITVGNFAFLFNSILDFFLPVEPLSLLYFLFIS